MNTEKKQSLIKSLQGNKFFLKEKQKAGLVIVTNNLNQEFWFDEETFEEQIELHNLNKGFFRTHKHYHFIQQENEVVIIKENPLEVKLSFKDYVSNLVKTHKHRNYLTFNDTTLNEQVRDNTVLFSKYEDDKVKYLIVENGEVYEFIELFKSNKLFFDYLYENLDNSKSVISLSKEYLNLSNDKNHKCTCEESCPNKNTNKCCKEVTSENVTEKDLPEDVRDFVLDSVGMDTLKEALRIYESGSLIPIRLPDFTQGAKDLKELYNKSTVNNKSFSWCNDHVTLNLCGIVLDARYIVDSEPYIEYTLKKPNNADTISLSQRGFVEGQEPTLMSLFSKEVQDISVDKLEQIVGNIMKYSLLNQLDITKG